MPLSSDRLGRYIPVVQLFAARLVLFHSRVAECLGLTATEFKCFRLLDQLGPLSLTQLAREAGLRMGTTSDLVDKLEAAGLVTRQRDAADRRRMVLAASPKARKRIETFYRDQGRTMGELLDTFKPAEFDAIIRFLEEASSVLARSHAGLELGATFPTDRLAGET